MKYLIDTHVFISLAMSESAFPERVAHIITSDIHQVYLSDISIWEIQIKSTIGKLPLVAPLESMVSKVSAAHHLERLALVPDHIFALALMPLIHRDPFDRLLIAQAQTEGYTLITSDPMIHRYNSATLWE